MEGQFSCTKCNGSGKVRWRHVANGVCFKCGGTGTLNYNPHPDFSDCSDEVEDNGEWYYQMRQEEGEKGLLEWALSNRSTLYEEDCNW